MRAYLVTVGLAIAACSQPTPKDAAEAREGLPERAAALPDTVRDMIQARVPAAVAGDSGWAWSERVTADMDDDGAAESVVVISDVVTDRGGRPLWEDGHRWQVYVEDEGRVTRLYARFLPNGRLTARLVAPASGPSPTVLLLEETPDHVGAYEFRYLGPDRFTLWKRLDRAVDPRHQFTRP